MRVRESISLKILAMALAVAVAITTIVPVGYVSAAEQMQNSTEASATLATASDVKEGLCKVSDKYYYFVKGKKYTKQGWLKVNGSLTIYVGTAGKVTSKLVTKDSVRKLYNYNSSTQKWTLQKNVYKTINGVIYYFSSKSGKAVKMYKKSSSQLYKYTNSKMTLVKRDISTINTNRIYYFNSKGKRVKTSGWYTLTGGTKVYVCKKGYVTKKLATYGKTKKYCVYDYKTLKWKADKSVWHTVSGVTYYFNKNGVAVTKYNTKTKAAAKYKSGKFTAVKKDILTLSNKKIYYVGAKGKVVKTAGWYTLASGTKVCVGKNGYVTAKITKYGKTNKYYAYNYKTSKWVLKKNVWRTVAGKTYYFNKNGKATVLYYTKSKKLYLYENGKFVTGKKVIQKLDNGKLYYFGSKGTKVTKAGWYSMSDTDMVQVGSKGYVTMKFSTESGKLLKYNYKTKKWARVKVSEYTIDSKTYYFDSDGILAKNKIVSDANGSYFYVDETGCKVTTQIVQIAVNFVRQHTNDSMTQEQKLYACFIYLSRNYPYLRDYVVPTDASRFVYYATDMLTNNHGNCYRCAASFAYVATVLGYKARVTCGKVTNLQGTGFTIHGWTELWREEDNQWVVYDVSMQRNWPARNYYHVLMSNYYPTHRVIGPRARLTIKNGADSWRWLKDSELSDH